jgi:phosphate transport system substrate-binding protein
MRTSYLFLAAIIAILAGCKTQQTETTTSGHLHIDIPESIAPVVISEVDAFLGLYRQNGAEITYSVVPQEVAVRHFVYDTARLGFFARPLTQQEEKLARKATAGLSDTIIAYDAITAVVHPENPVEQMTTTDLQKILEGRIRRWNQIPSSGHQNGEIRFYYQDSTDIGEYLGRRLLGQKSITAKFERTASDWETIQAVARDPEGFGLVALGWIDSAKSSVKVLKLGRTKEDKDTTFAPPKEAIGMFFSPAAANIYLNYYPLKRPIYMYIRTQLDLAAGFGTYVATSEGQKIILKCRLLPGTQNIKIANPYH